MWEFQSLSDCSQQKCEMSFEMVAERLTSSFGNEDTWNVWNHQSNYPPPLFHIPDDQACHQPQPLCVSVCTWDTLVALFSCLLVWWWRDFVLFPFGSWTPPIPLPLFSHHLLVPRHLPLSSLPGVEYEREQPVLSRHKDRSCQQVVIATVSLSAATSLLGKRECGESQGPSLCSLAAQIRGVTVFFWHPFK